MLLSVLNSSLLPERETAHLTADQASASGTITVDNITGFAVGKYILIGEFGDPTAEIIRIHVSTAPTGTTVTLNSNTTFDHYAGAKVTMIDYNQVEFSRATTLTGSKSVLSTVSISADRLETIYNDLTNSTGYGFVRFKNSSDSIYSDYSDGVNYTGAAADSFGELATEGCNFAGVTIGADYATEAMLYRDINACLKEISQKQDWSFEVVTNITSLTTTENENEFSLASLTYPIKHAISNRAILDVRIGTSKPLDYLSPDDMDREMEGVVHGYLSSAVTAGDTSVTLTDSYEFNSDAGTISLGSNNGVAYTANTETTGVLSGISATAITADVASGGSVWQGVSPGLPTKYTIIEEKIVFNVPIDTDYVGQKIKIRYLKKLDTISTFGDIVDVSFYNAIPLYIAYRIETRKRNFEVAKDFYTQFMDKVNDNLNTYAAPIMDGMYYWEKST